MPHPGRPYRIGDDNEREHPLERLIQQRQGAEAFVPVGGVPVLRIDGKRRADDFRRYGQCPPAGCQQQFAAKSLPLYGQIDRQTPEPKDRHVVAAELPRQFGGYTGERNGAGADRPIRRTCDDTWYARGL